MSRHFFSAKRPILVSLLRLGGAMVELDAPMDPMDPRCIAAWFSQDFVDVGCQNCLDMGMGQYLYIFSGIFTSINPSYDLGFTRYRGFDPSPYDF
mgnify:CR=1 FL=1